MTDKVGETNKKNIKHDLIDDRLGDIPVIGSSASEIFGLVVTPPLERRRAEWMNEVANELKQLESKQEIDFDKLKENEQFIDVVLQATTFALKTSEVKKIECFRNTIINTALGDSPEKTKSQIFLNQLDKFTTWHVSILDFIDDPNKWFERKGIKPPNLMMGSLYTVIVVAFPELKAQSELLNLIWSDLESTGFHNSGNLKTMMSGNGVFASRTTSIGKEFINFINILQ